MTSSSTSENSTFKTAEGLRVGERQRERKRRERERVGGREGKGKYSIQETHQMSRACNLYNEEIYSQVLSHYSFSSFE